jgi:hypothetical protein
VFPEIKGTSTSHQKEFAKLEPVLPKAIVLTAEKQEGYTILNFKFREVIQTTVAPVDVTKV